VIIGAGVLPEGQSSSAEFAEVMRRSSVTIGERTVTVPIVNVVGGVSDNATGAVGVSKLYAERKKNLVAAIPTAVMETATDDEKLVWGSWHLLRCEMHKIALWSTHFVGGKLSSDAGPSDPLFKVSGGSDPDKCKMIHGRTEHYVQSRLTAWPYLRRFYGSFYYVYYTSGLNRNSRFNQGTCNMFRHDDRGQYSGWK